MTCSTRIAGIAFLLAALSAPALGQDVASIQPGDTVRLLAGRVSGVHVVLQNSGFALELRDRRDVVRTVPMADMRRLERLEGRTASGGALQGAAVGLIAGVALGAVLGNSADDPNAMIPGSVVGASFGGLAGTLGGALIGAARGAPRWRAVRPASR
jgi:hypothetical protein